MQEVLVRLIPHLDTGVVQNNIFQLDNHLVNTQWLITEFNNNK